jgi:HSP20 family protein
MAMKPTTKATTGRSAPKVASTFGRAAAQVATAPQAEPHKEEAMAAIVATPAAAAWHAVEDLRRQVDRLFVEFTHGSWLSAIKPPTMNLEPIIGRWLLGNAPAVDVLEKDKSYVLTVELPGVDESAVEVTLRDGNIVILGERQEEKDETGKGYQIRERRFGSFHRSLPIPQGVEVAKIEASFKNGVLMLTMPKARTQAPERKIRIKPAG